MSFLYFRWSFSQHCMQNSPYSCGVHLSVCWPSTAMASGAHAPPSNREGSKASECTDSPAHVVASLAVWHFRGTSVCLHPNSAQSALPPTRMRALVASVRYRQVQQQRAGRDEAVKYSLSATKHRNDVSRRSSFTAQGHSLMRASV